MLFAICERIIFETMATPVPVTEIKQLISTHSLDYEGRMRIKRHGRPIRK